MKIRQMGAQLPMQTDRYEEANSRFSQFFELARKVKAVTVHSVKEYWGGGRGITPLFLNLDTGRM